jgi:hypothetical protein
VGNCREPEPTHRAKLAYNASIHRSGTRESLGRIVGKPEVGLRTPHPKSAIYLLSGLLAANLPLLPSRLQLPVPYGPKIRLVPYTVD